MGRDKALLSYRGRTFLDTIVSAVRGAAITRIAVVLGHHAAEIQSGSKLHDVEIVINSGYKLGQTSSLQAGLRVLNSPEVEAVILCLVDHPAVSGNVIRGLIKDYEQFRAPVVIPAFQGRRGHPVLIARSLFPELLALPNDQGADTVVRKYCEATRLIETGDSAVLLDVDTREAYDALLAAMKSEGGEKVDARRQIRT
jgi:molybdenum cofactor cytidylyltransferase